MVIQKAELLRKGAVLQAAFARVEYQTACCPPTVHACLLQSCCFPPLAFCFPSVLRPPGPPWRSWCTSGWPGAAAGSALGGTMHVGACLLSFNSLGVIREALLPGWPWVESHVSVGPALPHHEQINHKKKCRAIGVSNFSTQKLQARAAHQLARAV